MKKKTLIIPVVAAMLAVSCGGTPAPGKDWSSEIKDFMTAEFGEVLPYFDFDEASLYWESAKDEFGGYFFAYDDNETDLTESYGAKLISAGFTYDEESEAYYKESSVSTLQFSMYYYEPEVGSTALPGNVVDVEYLYNNAPSGAWSEAIQAEMMATFGEVLPYAFLDKETTESGNSTTMQWYVYDDNTENKLVSFGNRLVNDGWVYAGDDTYYKQIGASYVELIAGFYDYEVFSFNEIDVSVLETVMADFPYANTEVALRYASKNSLVVTIPDFEVASEDAFFVYQEDASSSSQTADIFVYSYNTTSAELGAYVSALVEEGFIILYADGGDYSFSLPGTGLFVSLVDFTVVPEEDPEEGGEVPPAPPAPSAYFDGEEPSEEEPEPSAGFYFSYDASSAYDYENHAVANTIAYKLGIPLDVIEEKEHASVGTYYEIYYEFIGMTTDQLNAAVKAAVPADYYFSAEDSQSWADEDYPTATDYYDVFYIDGYVEGGQKVQCQILAFEGAENAVLWLQVLGDKIELSWTALEAATAFTNYWNGLTGQSFEPSDISASFGAVAYEIGLQFQGIPVAVMASYCNSGLKVLLGFETVVKAWTLDDEDETSWSYGWYYTVLKFDNVVAMCYITDNQFDFVAYEIPANVRALD